LQEIEMKLARNGDDVTRIGLGVEREFKIKATAKAFRILSSGLYKDKIGAILREISANAYDAHTAAGCPDRPFVVHLPNTLEPWLSIRDFGPGLSHTDIFDIYTTYFESTKTDSNDYVGALGLGSKAPFSYVNAFTVVSRHAGMRRTYDAFIDEDGMPSIALRNESPVDENVEEGENTEHGLEVIVPVSEYRDTQEFVRKAATTYAYYPIKPIVTGVRTFEHTVQKVIFEGEGYQIRERVHSYSEKNGARAIMGIVGYPIDSETLRSSSEEHIDPRHLGKAQKTKWDEEHVESFLSAPIDIHFPIGSLDITAGREELSYDPSTVKALRAKISEIIKDLKKRLAVDFAKCKTSREARFLYGKLVSHNSAIVTALGERPSIEFKGEKIDSENYTFKMIDFPKTTFIRYGPSPYNERDVRSVRIIADKIDRRLEFQVPSDPCVEMFIKDMAGGYSQRVFQYRKNDLKRTVILVDSPDPEEFQKIKDILGVGYSFRNVSELDKVTPKPRQRVPVSKLMHIGIGATTLPSPRYSPWTEANVDADEVSGTYVRTRHHKFEFDNGIADLDANEKSEAFAEVLLAAVKLGIWDSSKDDLYAIPITALKTFAASPEWTQATDVIRERFVKLINKAPADFAKMVALSKAKREFSAFQSKSDWRAPFNRLADLLPPDHSIRKFVELEKEFFNKNDFDYYETIAHNLGIKLVEPVDRIDVVKQWRDIFKKYPVLHIIKVHRYDETPSIANLADYVKAMDHVAGDTK
jgi:hypothetical protein